MKGNFTGFHLVFPKGIIQYDEIFFPIAKPILKNSNFTGEKNTGAHCELTISQDSMYYLLPQACTLSWGASLWVSMSTQILCLIVLLMSNILFSQCSLPNKWLCKGLGESSLYIHASRYPRVTILVSGFWVWKLVRILKLNRDPEFFLGRLLLSNCLVIDVRQQSHWLLPWQFYF